MRLISQCALLVGRGWSAFFSDKTNCLWAFLQVPLIAVLTVVAFQGFSSDEKVLDYFLRFVKQGQNYLDARENGGESVYVTKVTARDIHLRAQQDHISISVATAQRRSSVYCLLISAAIWFGLTGSCKEIVNEQHVLRREVRSCFKLAPYLGAKLILQMVVVGLQTGLLVLMVAPLLLGLAAGSVVLLWIILWITATASASMGLLVSGGSPNIRVALTFVPLLMIPQFLFGGMLRPAASATEDAVPPQLTERSLAPKVDDSGRIRNAIGCLAIQKWGVEAALAMDPYSANGVLAMSFSWPETETDSQWRSDDFLRMVKARESSLVSVVVGDVPSVAAATRAPHVSLDARFRHEHVLRPILVLVLMSAGFMGGCYGMLRLRFCRGG